MTKNEKPDVEEACPFPPNVSPLPKKLPSRDLFSKDLLGDWRIILPLLTFAMALLVYGLLITPPPIIPTFKSPSTWNSSFPTVYPSGIKVPTNWTPKYTNQTIQKGDLILAGEDALNIENCTYILNGKLFAKDNAKIVLRNAELLIDARGGWSPSYDIPNNLPGSIILTNSSSYISESSSIVSSSYFEVTTWGTSSLILKKSNTTQGMIFCDDQSKFLAEKCIFADISVTSNASCVIRNSKLIGARFDSRLLATSGIELLTKGSIEFHNSSVNILAIAIVNSRVNIVGWNGGVFDHLSPSDFSSGGSYSNVTFINSKLSYLNLFTRGCNVTIANSSNISPTIYDSDLTITNTKSASLDVIRSNAFIQESVIGFFNVVNNTIKVKDTRVDILLLHRFDGVLECDQVKANSLQGSDSEGGLVRGSLAIVNSTNYMFPSKEQVKRSFEVLVAAGDRAVPNAELSLLDASGREIWSSSSDLNGRAVFNLTFNRLMPVGEDNITKTFTLRVVVNNVKMEKNQIGILSCTPIKFSFPSNSDSMWIKWGLEIAGFSILAIVSIVYLYIKSRKGKIAVRPR